MNSKTKLPSGFKTWVIDTQYEHPTGHKLRLAVAGSKTIGGVLRKIKNPTKQDKEYLIHLLLKFERDKPIHTSGGWKNTK